MGIEILRNKILLTGLIVGIALASTGCNEGKKAYEKGVSYMEKKEYGKAVDSFALATEKTKDKAEYKIAYGMALLQNEQYEQAIEIMQSAIGEKNNAIVRENNKYAYRGIGLAYYVQESYEEAEEYFEKALEYEEAEDLDRELLDNLLAVQELTGRVEEAVKTCDRLIAKDKKNITYYKKKALLHCSLEVYEDALKDYEKIVELNGKNYDGYFGQSAVYKLMGETEKAVDVLKPVLKIKGKTAEDKCYLGRAYFETGDKEQAISYLQESAGEYITAGYYLGEIYLADGKYKEAETAYEAYLKAAPENMLIMAYNQAALCAMNREDFEKAYEYISEGIEKKEASSLKTLEYNLVVVQEKRGDFEAAKTAAEDYLAHYGEDEKMAKELAFINTRIK